MPGWPGFFGDQSGLLRGVEVGAAQILQHDHEFVAADTGHRIAVAHAIGQAPGNLPQEQVALVVAQGVVEDLEVVEIDEQQRHGAAAAHCICQGMLQPVEQHAPVGKSGQLVVIGKPLDFLL